MYIIDLGVIVEEEFSVDILLSLYMVKDDWKILVFMFFGGFCIEVKV